MIWNTFKYTLKRELRDKISMGLMIIFPIIIALIVGNALKNDFEVPVLGKAKIAIINSDKELYSKMLTDIFVTDNMLSLLDINEDITTLKAAEANFEDGIIDAYLYIEEGYSKSIMMGERDNSFITLYDSDKRKQSMEVVKHVITKYNKNLDILSDKNLTEEKRDEVTDLLDAKSIVKSGLSSEHKPTSMDYYGVTLIVLICLYGALYPIKILNETVYGEYGLRLKTITKKDYKVFIGVGLASYLFISIQVLVLTLFYKYIYKVYLGTNYWDLILMLAVFILFINVMGFAIITVLRNYSIAYTLANVLILSSTFISSGFVILNLGNGLLNNIVENYLPNAVCQNAIFSIIYNTKSIDLSRTYFVLFIWIIVLLGITIVFKRKEYSN